MKELAQLDAEKRRTIGVLASGNASAIAVKRIIDLYPDSLLRLALLVATDGWSPLRTKRIELSDLVLANKWHLWPDNVVALIPSMGVDRSFIASVSLLIWAVDDNALYRQHDSIAQTLAAITALAEREGVPVQYRDMTGGERASPMHGLLSVKTVIQLAGHAAARRRITNRCIRSGLMIDPEYSCILWTAGGLGIDLSTLDISMPLLWRILRLQNWYEHIEPTKLMTAQENKLFLDEATEIAQCLRTELGADLRVDLSTIRKG